MFNLIACTNCIIITLQRQLYILSSTIILTQQFRGDDGIFVHIYISYYASIFLTLSGSEKSVAEFLEKLVGVILTSYTRIKLL